MSKENKAPVDAGKSLTSLLKAAKVAKVMFIVGVIALAIGLVLSCASGEAVFFLTALPIGLVLIIVRFIINGVVSSKRKKHAIALTQTVLGEIMDKLEDYSPRASVNHSYINSGLGFPSYDRIGHCGDYVKGVYKGMAFQSSDFELEEEREERDDEGNVTRSYVSVYRGRIIVCEHGRDLGGSFCLSQSVHFIGDTSVKTESEAFNRAFSIRTDNAHDVFYVLTPHYMEKLVNMSDSLGGKSLNIRYCSDGKLIIAIRGLDFFEIGNASDIEGIKKSFSTQMEFLGDIMEKLEVPKTQEGR